MRIDKKSLVFLFLGALIAVSLEQLLWWDLIISKRGEIHNDFWVLISENIKPSLEGSNLTVVYSTDINQAILVLNIWKILLLISFIALIILIVKK